MIAKAYVAAYASFPPVLMTLDFCCNLCLRKWALKTIEESGD